jgi:DNA-binding NarL/FixJ family response regulator
MKILLVEDSRVLRERLRSLIAELPHAVVVGEADNERDALHCLSTYRPDTLVLDLKLKSGSGLSVLEHVKASYPQTTVLVLTNCGQPEYRGKCMDLGADYFFDKSRDFDAFSLCLNGMTPHREGLL